uniref:Dickkopf N-terminal cysteine-rich domain-containing protein n=1 Tax=Romanomermis culicivorax TaxID=13658 RepID=A0A915I7L0_ROMCU
MNGLNQACKEHRQCDFNSFCDFHYGICKPYRTHGQMCRSDDHCAKNLQCTFGRCASLPKLGHNGARCKDDGDCLPSLCCARQHGQKVCKPKLKLGQNCFVSEGGLSEWLNSMCPCDEGLICGFSSSKGRSRYAF